MTSIVNTDGVFFGGSVIGFTLLWQDFLFYGSNSLVQSNQFFTDFGQPSIEIIAACVFSDNILETGAETISISNADYDTMMVTFERNLFIQEPLSGQPTLSIFGSHRQHLILRNNTCINFVGIDNPGIEQDTRIEVVNNIFYGSDPGGAYLFCNAGPNMEYDFRFNCLWRAVNDGCPLGPGHIFVDPMFCNPVQDDYRLDPDSPCIGTGEGGVSMGAFGVGCGSTAVNDEGSPSVGVNLRVDPNPLYGHGAIEWVADAPGRTLLRVHDSSGRVVLESDLGQRVAGRHAVRWESISRHERLPLGVYFLELHGPWNPPAVTRVIILR